MSARNSNRWQRVVIAALRHALKASEHEAGPVRREIISMWPDLDQGTKETIKADIEGGIETDDLLPGPWVALANRG